MAGVWTPRERHLYAASFKESWSVYVGSHAAQLIVMSDVELVHFASYGTANGTVLIAGTGSIAVRKDFEGTLHRAGGWGHTVDDAGSGMWLGQMACKAVARMLDGRGPETLLIRPVASYLRVDAEYPDEVRAALRGAELRSISKIGGAVLTYAEEGDTVAQSIRALGAEELALMCKAVSSENHQQITGYGSLLINAQYAKLVSDIVDMPFALLDDVVASIPLRLG
jgi:N-acetylglucosamine kinase-like BadF-type ATPase